MYKISLYNAVIMKNTSNRINLDKIYMFYFIFLIISLVVVAIITRNSFEGKEIYNKNINMSNLIVVNSKAHADYYDDNSSLEDILNKAKIILKVKMTNNSEYMNQCRLSEVKILEIYKNEEGIDLGGNIYIYEPAYPHVESGEVCLDGGYIPMIENKEYIVLLKPLKVPQGYQMSKKEAKSFMYCSLGFGKYCSENLSPYIISDKSNNQLELKDLEGYNIMIDNKNLDKYNTFVSMMSKYK